MSTQHALGAPEARTEALDKAMGAARYAAEHTPPGCAHARPVPASIARGRVAGVNAADALALPGVIAVLTHENAPRLSPPDDPTLFVLQDPRVPHRGWFVALVVAETPEAALEGAAALHITYDIEAHDVTLTAGHSALYVPDEANGGFPGASERGSFDTAFAEAPLRVDARYDIGPLHNHPMEPHACTAQWRDGRLTLHYSSQGSTTARDVAAAMFGLDRGQVTVVSEHVGGGFGSKGTPRPEMVLAAMAAREIRRPVKLALPRRMMAPVVGHRAPTLHRVRLGADADGVLTALSHEVATHTSTIKEFVEQAAVPARVMYASPNSRTVHRVAPLDVPSPSWMRAPGEAPGMYALESAMDELALLVGIDPIELRLRNEPDVEPDSGRPFSSRGLPDCLREGARRFGWDRRDPRPGATREGHLLLGTGVAAATYPVLLGPSQAEVHADPDGTYRVRINATDIGTGARTVLGQIAAEVLGTRPDNVHMDIGNSDLPSASLAGGSSGTASWGTAVHKACLALRSRFEELGGQLPAEGVSARGDSAEESREVLPYARHAFGAHFAEVQVDAVTGETRVRRLLGMYAAGHILNPRTARSQFIGGMTMGLGMALTEHSTVDRLFGDFAESDLAAYHVPTHADVPTVEAYWLDEEDPYLNPMGSKGIGEIGIVGTAAAIANAVCHATGVRVRDLPVTPDKLLAGLG
ncbi:xanthine dehydrogenase family protein molybdopterin-binding subunit [Streptomyces sp. NA04227]|uniref:xanthine dehydrogenase family protein molybdopterin-binding subunit n=1 Tax=Streptomyces sp. NA04227 TaxID=2742136 RepID=UPI00158FB0F6|nr:xanthine dehydrogenase family protein molybdopterin-binding subunit [Streptomyces sp. NA04227]QKW10035.1 xanthine dehydrogenase family protein molybdopterin-binding subunit [Streptomyces sp. NA04227]